MNDLEERLRAALDARAQTYETSPTAWLRVQERRRGPLRRWGVVLVALPVALVALLVPVLLGGFQGGQVMTGPPPEPAPVGQALVIDNPAENRPMRLWFATDHKGLLVFCRAVQYAGEAPHTVCGGDVGAQAMESVGWFEGTTQSVPPRENVLDYGAARLDVATVTAVTKKGTRVAGAVHRPSGAPFKIWTVDFPDTDQVTAYEFTATDGRLLSRVARPFAMPPEAEQGEPAGDATKVAGLSVRPYKTPDRTLIWSLDGRELGLNHSAKELLRNMGGKPMDVDLQVNGGRWFGIARPATAKVELVRKDGKVLRAAVKQDPWKFGVRLFAGEEPVSGDLYLEGFTLVGYDSGGKELWREDHPADKPAWDPHPPIGEVVTLGEAKVWFSKVTLADGRTWDGLCRSMPGKKTTCDAFEPVATHYARRLPDLGTIAIGVAGTGITQVTAQKSETKGTIHAPAGAPLKIWTVPYPGGTETFDLRDARGELGMAIGGEAPSGCSVSPPVGRAATLAGGVTVTHQDGCLIMWRDGQQFTVEMRDFEDATYTYGDEIFTGIAIKGTARVEMVYDDGSRLVAAATTPDPWGLGLVLFSTPAKKAEGGALVIGYDAAGKELWRLD
ncbi:hypothetical protein GCM10010412_053770 [Nonomuraea recticatena]|uniref:Uncharacterized protein n=1 Tax=Nonomuraea recticatena TaxID=46178 RepID=A0ABN3SFR7_9ACTN